MIGFLLRGITSPLFCIAAVFGVCSICACCRRCNIRDCACIRWLFRKTGADPFDDFEAIFQVHECFHAGVTGQLQIRITAGREQVITEKSSKGNFQETLTILIEQGTEYVTVDMMVGRTVHATLELEVTEEILTRTDNSADALTFTMDKVSKKIQDPGVKLTIFAVSEKDAESGLLAGPNMSSNFALNSHLAHAQAALAEKGGGGGVSSALAEVLDTESAGELQVIDVLMAGSSGKVEIFSGFGSKKARYVEVEGPPKTRNFRLNLYKTPIKDQKKEEAPDKEIEILKIKSVYADAQKHNVFHISYVDSHKASHVLAMVASDRPAAVWVDTLVLLVEKVHTLHTMQKDNKAAGSRSIKDKSRK